MTEEQSVPNPLGVEEPARSFSLTDSDCHDACMGEFTPGTGQDAGVWAERPRHTPVSSFLLSKHAPIR